MNYFFAAELNVRTGWGTGGPAGPFKDPVQFITSEASPVTSASEGLRVSLEEKCFLSTPVTVTVTKYRSAVSRSLHFFQVKPDSQV